MLFAFLLGILGIAGAVILGLSVAPFPPEYDHLSLDLAELGIAFIVIGLGGTLLIGLFSRFR